MTRVLLVYEESITYTKEIDLPKPGDGSDDYDNVDDMIVHQIVDRLAIPDDLEFEIWHSERHFEIVT